MDHLSIHSSSFPSQRGYQNYHTQFFFSSIFSTDHILSDIFSLSIVNHCYHDVLKLNDQVILSGPSSSIMYLFFLFLIIFTLYINYAHTQCTLYANVQCITDLMFLLNYRTVPPNICGVSVCTLWLCPSTSHYYIPYFNSTMLTCTNISNSPCHSMLRTLHRLYTLVDSPFEI